MATELETETDFYRIEWDDEIDTVIFTWTDFATGDRFKEGANALLEAFERRDSSKVINDTSGIQAHNEEDKRWLQEEWIPKILDAGMEYNVIVHKESVISEMDIEAFSEQLEKLPYEHHMTDSMDDAREWMASK